MRQEKQAALIERCLADIAAKRKDMQGTAVSPAARYTDPARHAREMEKLIRGYPMQVGFTSQIPAPGDFLTHDATGVPILVSRQPDGGVRAFLNICRHRGARLVSERTGGGKRRFACPYHAWTYGQDGALLAVTDPAGFPDLDKSCHGLIELPAGEAFGLIFVRPSPAGDAESTAIDVPAFLGPEIAEDFESFGLAEHIAYQPTVYPKAINWKLFMDTSLEGYHFVHLHRNTIASMFMDNQSVMDWFAPHARNLLPKRSLAGLADAPESDWDIRAHSNILYAIFPNLVVLVQPDHAAVMQVFPTDVGRTEVHWTTLLPEAPASAKARSYWQANMRIFFEAIEEDYLMAEQMQANMETGLVPHLNFGRFEWQVARFHEAVEEALRTDSGSARHAAE